MLEARNITFGYGDEQPLYKDFNITFGSNERVALVAPSGFGKTTLCRLLSGYEKPQQGNVLVDGVPLPQKGVCPVQLIGQHPEQALDPRLRMKDSLVEAGAIDSNLLEALGIRAEWLNRFPHELSGGEMQRFCIARALATNPRYLIADEISTMLDALTQAQLWHFIIETTEQKGIGLLFVSHSPALTSKIATHIVNLGRVCNRDVPSYIQRGTN